MFEVQFKLEKSSNKPLYSIQRQRFIFKTIIFWTNHLSNTPCCNSHCKTLSLFFTLLPFLGLFHLKDCLQVRCRMTVDICCRSLISLKKGGFAKARLKMYFQYRSATFWSKLNWAMRASPWEVAICLWGKKVASLAIIHVGAEALLLCRQLHKRAINNLWPGNYRTFSNTHGPGSFCLTNLS